MAALVAVLGALAAISLRGGASSASTVAPSARPAANAFARAYVEFLNGRLTAQALPDATSQVKGVASSGGRVPKAYRGKAVLHRVAFNGVLGARRASALVLAGAGSRRVEAQFTLGYARGRWQITSLVPPDFSTLFAPGAPPVRVPAAERQAAAEFALAYANYRTGAGKGPPAGLSTIRSQIATHHDPLAGIRPTRTAARLVQLQMLPQGELTVVDAVLAAGGRRLAFGFTMEQAGGHWQAWQFPVREP